MRITPFIGLAIVCIAAAPAAAQTSSARAQTLAGEFSKLKDATKNKRGISIRKYHEVVSEPWVASAAAYKGEYASTNDFAFLNLTVDGDGRVSGSGRDREHFTLRNVSIAGGLLTGTKVYQGGDEAPFEAAFLKRSDRASPNGTFTTLYGVGFIVKDEPNYDLRVFATKQ